MFLSIVQMVLPVLIAFGLGTLCKRKSIIGEEGLKGLKAVVGKITLPAVLFYAFLTAEYSGRIALTFGTVFLACVLGLLAGYALRRFVKPYGKYLPFLLTEFEGGMLGYALFGLLYAGQTHIFAMIDIGQTFCTFTVFFCRAQSRQRRSGGPENPGQNRAAQRGAHRDDRGRAAWGAWRGQVGHGHRHRPGDLRAVPVSGRAPPVC